MRARSQPDRLRSIAVGVHGVGPACGRVVGRFASLHRVKGASGLLRSRDGRTRWVPVNPSTRCPDAGPKFVVWSSGGFPRIFRAASRAATAYPGAKSPSLEVPALQQISNYIRPSVPAGIAAFVSWCANAYAASYCIGEQESCSPMSGSCPSADHSRAGCARQDLAASSSATAPTGSAIFTTMSRTGSSAVLIPPRGASVGLIWSSSSNVTPCIAGMRRLRRSKTLYSLLPMLRSARWTRLPPVGSTGNRAFRGEAQRSSRDIARVRCSIPGHTLCTRLRWSRHSSLCSLSS